MGLALEMNAQRLFPKSKYKGSHLTSKRVNLLWVFLKQSLKKAVGSLKLGVSSVSFLNNSPGKDA